MPATIQDFSNWALASGANAPPGGSLLGLFMSGYAPYGPVPTGASTPGGTSGTTPTGSPVTTPGAPPFGYSSAYGGIPQVPWLPTAAAQAVGGNIANLPGLTGMGGAVNAFNQQQQLGQYQLYNPALLSNLGQSATNIGAELRGELPQDVQDYIGQAAAERGVSLGIPGSQASEYNYLRGLGLSSLDMMRLGESNLTAAMGRTPKLSLYDISSMFVTPQQQAQAQWQANVMAAAPVPISAAQANIGAAGAGLGSGYCSGYNPWSFLSRIFATPTSTGSTGSSYVPASGAPASYVPAGGGWGESWGSTGGYGSYGTVPASAELYPGSGWTAADWAALYPGEAMPDFSYYDY